MNDPLMNAAILAERAVNEAMELLEVQDKERLLALVGRLVQLDRMILQVGETLLRETNVVTCCGECPAASEGDSLTVTCDFEKQPIKRTALWDQPPPVWCPLRQQSYVLETILKPFGER